MGGAKQGLARATRAGGSVMGKVSARGVGHIAKGVGCALKGGGAVDKGEGEGGEGRGARMGGVWAMEGGQGAMGAIIRRYVRDGEGRAAAVVARGAVLSHPPSRHLPKCLGRALAA